MGLRQVTQYAAMSERTVRAWIHASVDALPAGKRVKREVEARLAHGGKAFLQPERPARPTLAEYATGWLKKRRARAKTQRSRVLRAVSTTLRPAQIRRIPTRRHQTGGRQAVHLGPQGTGVCQEHHPPRGNHASCRAERCHRRPAN